MRLLHAYGSIQKDRKLRVYDPPRALNNQAKQLSKTRSNVAPGSAEWSKLKMGSNMNERRDEIGGEGDDNKVAVGLRYPRLAWFNISCPGQNSPSVFFNKQCYLSVSAHVGEGRVFAVASATVSSYLDGTTTVCHPEP
jgi:hypothetical protein